MARYIKYNSSYILRKKHQQTTKGTILYRDWVTTGSLNRFVPGKKPYYQDSNFVFTISNVSDYQKKHKNIKNSYKNFLLQLENQLIQ